MSGKKRLALFLDGTWNTKNDDTNVWRLKSLCTENDDQVCYYSPGVGTQFGQRVLGGGFGYGLDDEVIRAYQWIMENYHPEDRIFIFGFSRGAFTARSLAGFISKCGLLRLGSPMSLSQLYARYREGSTEKTIRELHDAHDDQLSQEERWLKKYSMRIPIWFQGVWDTVGALGIPFGHLPKVSRSNYAFLETDLRINYSRAYHALAIDEHRKAFSPTLWNKVVEKGAAAFLDRSLSDVEQRWFVGAHADVGGGYYDGLLAQRPLQWIMQKAEIHGLKFDLSIEIDGDSSQVPVRDSFAEMSGGLYRALKFWQPYYREIGAAPEVSGIRSTTTINETIDASVFARWRVNAGYRPPNVSAWAERHKVDVAALQVSVRADDLSVVPVDTAGAVADTVPASAI